jgi:hypothetical protein
VGTESAIESRAASAGCWRMINVLVLLRQGSLRLWCDSERLVGGLARSVGVSASPLGFTVSFGCFVLGLAQACLELLDDLLIGHLSPFVRCLFWLMSDWCAFPPARFIGIRAHSRVGGNGCGEETAGTEGYRGRGERGGVKGKPGEGRRGQGKGRLPFVLLPAMTYRFIFRTFHLRDIRHSMRRRGCKAVWRASQLLPACRRLSDGFQDG